MDAIERQRLTVACQLLGTSLVEELQKIEREHRLAWAQANDAYNDIRREAIAKAKAAIDATLEKEKAEVDALRDALASAEKDVLDAKVAAATKRGYNTGGEILPVGTKVYSGRKNKFGIIEVRTPETQFADNIAPYNVPSIGSFFVRLCMKDGTPGKRIDENCYRWHRAE